MQTPYSVSVDLTTNLDEAYESPEKAAEIAHETSPQKSITQRTEYIRLLAERRDQSEGAQALLKIIKQRSEAQHVLSMVGYENLRHLQADGITIPEIAMDLGLNQLDVMTFMSTHPQAVDHAQIDAAACADMKMAKFMRQVENATPDTKFESEKMRTQLQAVELLIKRLSPDWAIQLKDAGDVAATHVGITFNMDLSGQLAPTPPKSVNARVIENANSVEVL